MKHPKAADYLLNKESYALDQRINKLMKNSEYVDYFVWTSTNHHDTTIRYDDKRDKLYPTMRKLNYGDR